MKTIAVSLLKKLIDKYGSLALSYILTKILSFLFNRYGDTKHVVKQAEDITVALKVIIEATKDGVITEEEIKKAIPILEEAINFRS